MSKKYMEFDKNDRVTKRMEKEEIYKFRGRVSRGAGRTGDISRLELLGWTRTLAE